MFCSVATVWAGISSTELSMKTVESCWSSALQSPSSDSAAASSESTMSGRSWIQGYGVCVDTSVFSSRLSSSEDSAVSVTTMGVSSTAEGDLDITCGGCCEGDCENDVNIILSCYSKRIEIHTFKTQKRYYREELKNSISHWRRDVGYLYRLNVGPPSATLAQHSNSIGSTYLVQLGK